MMPPAEAPAAVERARALVLRYGWNATAYQIINPGIAHWFSGAGDAVAGYVPRHGVRVVAGAPVCDPVRLPAVCRALEEEARAERQRVCYFGAEERLESLYRDSPAHAMVLLGAQPAWHPESWSSIIARRASLRAQLHRARNKQVVVTEWAPARARGSPLLQDVLGQWLATRGLPPLHFLVEPETLQRLWDRRVFVAERAGVVVGFLLASPVPCRRGWLVEQIIRGPRAPNGTNELMIDFAMRCFAEGGYDYVTLGLSPLSRRALVPSRWNPLWLRAGLAWVRAHGRRFYNFDGLDAFKAKLQPEWWEPVFAIANEPVFTPSTLYAIAAAFTSRSPILTVLAGAGRAVRQELRWAVRGKGG